MPKARKKIKRASHSGKTIKPPVQTRTRLIITCAVVATTGLLLTTGFVTGFFGTVANNIMAKTGDAGLKIETILVQGRTNVQQAELMQSLDITVGAPIMAYDTIAALERLRALPWVASASIERRLPNTVFVTLHERKPLALWQRNMETVLIDGNGQILSSTDLSRYQSLPLLVGNNAPENAAMVLRALQQYPSLNEQVAALRWIGDRRWDIHLRSGIILRLPEATEIADLTNQFSALMAMQASHNIFSRAISAIDLRQPDRVIMQTKNQAEPSSSLTPTLIQQRI